MPHAGTQAHESRSAAAPRRRRVDAARRDDLLRGVEEIVLADGFAALTVNDLAQRLRCSKATLYSVAATKEQLVLAATKRFFAESAERVEHAAAGEPDPRLRIGAYLGGIAGAMRRASREFYDDMVTYGPTAEVYRRNTERAAQRVRELVEEGVAVGAFRATDGAFAAQVVALAIDAVQSGVLLERTGLTAAEAFAELADLLLHGLVRGG